MPLPTVKLQTIDAVRLLRFKAFEEENGTLVPVTGNADLPFSIARVFYIWSLQTGTMRGDHAHVACQQVLVCPRGSVEVFCDDGTSEKSFLLEAPNIGLYVPPTIWARQTYRRNGCLLMVFADQPYNEEDYLRNYDEFLSIRGVQRARAIRRFY